MTPQTLPGGPLFKGAIDGNTHTVAIGACLGRLLRLGQRADLAARPLGVASPRYHPGGVLLPLCGLLLLEGRSNGSDTRRPSLRHSGDVEFMDVLSNDTIAAWPGGAGRGLARPGAAWRGKAGRGRDVLWNYSVDVSSGGYKMNENRHLLVALENELLSPEHASLISPDASIVEMIAAKDEAHREVEDHRRMVEMLNSTNHR